MVSILRLVPLIAITSQKKTFLLRFNVFFVDSAAAPQEQGISTSEMDSLRAQIGNLASRVSEIDGSVIGISKLVGNLMMVGIKKILK